MKKFLSLFAIASAITLGMMVMVVKAAPTSTIVQNLYITGLKSSPNAVLSIDSNGLISTSTGGAGGGSGSSTQVGVFNASNTLAGNPYLLFPLYATNTPGLLIGNGTISSTRGLFDVNNDIFTPAPSNFTVTAVQTSTITDFNDENGYSNNYQIYAVVTVNGVDVWSPVVAGAYTEGGGSSFYYTISLSWNPVPNAKQYYVVVPGSNDYFTATSTAEYLITTSTSINNIGLPAGSWESEFPYKAVPPIGATHYGANFYIGTDGQAYDVYGFTLGNLNIQGKTTYDNSTDTISMGMANTNAAYYPDPSITWKAPSYINNSNNSIDAIGSLYNGATFYIGNNTTYNTDKPNLVPDPSRGGSMIILNNNGLGSNYIDFNGFSSSSVDNTRVRINMDTGAFSRDNYQIATDGLGHEAWGTTVSSTWQGHWAGAIKADSTSTLVGKVRIGSSSAPAYPLDVNGATNIVGALTQSGGVNTFQSSTFAGSVTSTNMALTAFAGASGCASFGANGQFTTTTCPSFFGNIYIAATSSILAGTIPYFPTAASSTATTTNIFAKINSSMPGIFIGSSTAIDSSNPGGLEINMGTSTSENAISVIGNINDFQQIQCQNVSTGTKAQCGFTATGNSGSATSTFMWSGINSSGFTDTSSWNAGLANDVVHMVNGTGNILIVATASSTPQNNIQFWTGGNASGTNTRFIIASSGLGTFFNALNIGGAVNMSSTLKQSGGINSLASTTFLGNVTGTTSFFTTASSTGLTFLNATTTGNLQVGTFHTTGAVTVSSTFGVTGASIFVGALTQSGGVVSQATTTVNGTLTSTGHTNTGNVTSTSMTDSQGNKFVTSTGGSPTINGFTGSVFQILGTGNVTGTTTNGSTTFSLINSGVSSGTYTAGTFTVASSGIITAASSVLVPTIATTTKAIVDISPVAGDFIPFFYSETAYTLKQVDCGNFAPVGTSVAGDTFAFQIVASSSLAATSTAQQIFSAWTTCTATTSPMTATSFASSSIPAGDWISVQVTSTAANVSTTGFYLDIKY